MCRFLSFRLLPEEVHSNLLAIYPVELTSTISKARRGKEQEKLRECQSFD